MNTQTQTYIELDAFIINQLPTGSTFGVDDAKQEQVFIPSSLARQHNVVPGETVRVRAIPNRKEGGARWFGIYIDRPVSAPQAEIAAVQPAAKEQPEDHEKHNEYVDWFEECLYALKELGGAATTRQVAEYVDWSVANVGSYMRILHERGKVARAGIRLASTQAKDSHVFWALNVHDLFPETSNRG